MNILARSFYRPLRLAGVSTLLLGSMGISALGHAQETRPRRAADVATDAPRSGEPDKADDKKEATNPIPAETRVETKHD